MATTARNILDFALLQSAAECYLHNVKDLGDIDLIHKYLQIGANDPEKQGKSEDDPILASATRFTQTQAKWFTDNYEIVTHYPNDASGFSCTLFRNKGAGEYTLSFRSTEYQLQEKGGDYERDGSDATDGDISTHGFGLAQLSSMEQFYEHLKQGETWNANTRKWEHNDAVNAFAEGDPILNLTGYSMGAHLATSFTLMHTEAVKETWNFNAAGLGGITMSKDENTIPTGDDVKYLIEQYNALIHYDGNLPEDPVLREAMLKSPYLGDFINLSSGHRVYDNVYENPLHGIVMSFLKEKMYPAGAGNKVDILDSMGDTRLADAWINFESDDPNSFTSNMFEVNDFPWNKIHQYYGHGEFWDMEFVANSGWHPSPESIFIEDLPLSRNFGIVELLAPNALVRDLVGEFGETHSITPLIDSLTVLDMLQRLDADFDLGQFVQLGMEMRKSPT
ncbi:MAG: hypothetical protein LBU11_03545 [Zoogloeaceae bacterium]|jgi:hypothetical protein|nr:hypothetical protein [Zoogloeaceae bacterium]